MSKLEYYARPLVAFDPNNKDHRRWYYQFVEYGGWGKCPVRFICPEDSGSDLTIMIKNHLIEHYIHKEFGKEKEKLVNQKTKKRLTKKKKGTTI